jgi:hypothetical protein
MSRNYITVVRQENPIVTPNVVETRVVEIDSNVGPRGEPGSKIIKAAGPPTSSVGRDGDYYIDETGAGLPLYGPKQNGQWPTLVIYSSDVRRYVHLQPSPSATWTINHTLGGFPSVTVVDSANTVVYGMVTYVSESQVVLTFSAPFSGSAYLT